MKSNELIRKAKKAGWVLKRQGKGSHEIYEKDGKTVSIPNHGTKEIPTGTEKSLKKQLGL